MKFLPSDLLALDSPERSSELLSAEFSAWCSAVAQLWEADDRLKDDFVNIGEFFNWAFAIAEQILRSVQ